MPTFSTTLPPEGPNRGYQLIRTPETGQISGIVTSENFIVCDTHYWHGRTTPCERVVAPDGSLADDAACQACGAKQPWRTHVYLSAFSRKTSTHFIFECTAAAAKPFAEYRDKTGSLRGCGFFASRVKPTKNSKVLILTKTADISQTPIPNAPNIIAALAVIWRLPGAAAFTQADYAPGLETEDQHQRREPTVRIDPELMHAMRTPEDNAGGEPHLPPRIRHVLDNLPSNGRQKKEPVPQ
jgi:hypothetical protein